jgi:hypothetical protein
VFESDDLACQEGDLPEGPWPEGTLHFYRTPGSTRGVEVTLEGREFEVRMMAASSPDDFDLAYRILEAIGGAGAVVRTEMGDPVPLPELAPRFQGPDVWEEIRPPLSTLARLIEMEGKTFTLPGPSEVGYAIGPETLSKLRSAGDEAGFPQRLIEDMRRVVHGDYAGYEVASQWRGGTEGDPFTLAMWLPGWACFLPASQFVLLQRRDDPDDGMVIIRREDLPAVASGFTTILDEEQALLDAAREEAWDEILQRAEQVEVELPGSSGAEQPSDPPPPAKRWWQFWR